MNEPLQATHPYPADRSFVIKLHRDADLAGGELRGRIVHLMSDDRGDFAGTASLLSTLRALIHETTPRCGAAGAATRNPAQGHELVRPTPEA